MQLGIFAKVFPRPTVEATFDAVAGLELDCVQFNLVAAGLPSMPDEITPAIVDRIARAAAARGIRIAAMSGTFNMAHPHPARRNDGLRRLRVLASACRAMRVPIITLCTGTRDPGDMWRRHVENDSPAAWRDMTSCVREAVDIAQEAGVVLAFEPEVANVVDSAVKARRLLDEIGSAHLKVLMDAANLFHAGELARMTEVLDEAFALLGRDIVLAHAKDLSRDGEAGHEAAGTGLLDYDAYVAQLRGCGFTGPLVLHGLTEAQALSCVAFLRAELARAAGTRHP